MKLLLLCRHGAISGNERQWDPSLSEKGRQEISDLANKVRSVAHRLPLTIWSSSSKRGRESTDILLKFLGSLVVSVEYFDEFWIDDDHPFKARWINSKIQSFEGEALLVMSHALIAEYPVSLGGEYFPLKTGECLMVRGGWNIKI